jgi:citrate lyase beta subunit
MSWKNGILRSLLFTPADKMKLLNKATNLKTDVVIVDLEDAGNTC